mgnify:CR=1 FL=1
MLPLIQEECVTRMGWISETEFLDVLAMCNALPGPIAIKFAALVGYKVGGVAGAGAALVGVAGPAVVLMGGVSAFYLRHRDHPAVSGALQGVRPVVIGMLAWVVVSLMPAGVTGVGSAAIALAAFGSLALGVHPALVIAVALGGGAAFLRG